MPTGQELKNTYSNLSTEKLFEILQHETDYTAEAIGIAREELLKRDPGLDELQAYYKNQSSEENKMAHNANLRLTFFEKLFFFFAWFAPMFTEFGHRMNYREDGMLTKLKQSRLFSIAGLISVLLVVLVAVTLDHDTLTTLILLLLLFTIFFFLEKKIGDKIYKLLQAN